MLLTEHLVHGVDVWINTPRRPWEASGTSALYAASDTALRRRCDPTRRRTNPVAAMIRSTEEKMMKKAMTITRVFLDIEDQPLFVQIAEGLGIRGNRPGTTLQIISLG